MKSILLLLSAGLALLISPPKTIACKCFEVATCDSYGKASSVFTGRMLGGSEEVDIEGETSSGRIFEAGKVRFAVEEVFKGTLGLQAEVTVESMKSTSCGPYGLLRGGEYLIYAYGDSGSLSTGVCTRTRLLMQAAEDLAFLKSLPPEGAGGSCLARCWPAGVRLLEG
jgi:hypothetical protein